MYVQMGMAETIRWGVVAHTETWRVWMILTIKQMRPSHEWQVIMTIMRDEVYGLTKYETGPYGGPSNIYSKQRQPELSKSARGHLMIKVDAFVGTHITNSHISYKEPTVAELTRGLRDSKTDTFLRPQDHHHRPHMVL
jgi:hypothetical protein